MSGDSGWKLGIEGLDAAIGALDGLSAEMKRSKRKILSMAGDELVLTFRRRILAQQFVVAPLRPATIEKKKADGHDLRVFVRTEEYVRSLRYRASKEGEITLYAEGSDPIQKRPYASLAEWLENGTRTMLPRPHWGPFGEWARKNVLPKYARLWAKKALEASIKKARAKHGEVE